jgi:hypothetical protein
VGGNLFFNKKDFYGAGYYSRCEKIKDPALVEKDYWVSTPSLGSNSLA